MDIFCESGLRVGLQPIHLVLVHHTNPVFVQSGLGGGGVLHPEDHIGVVHILAAQKGW